MAALASAAVHVHHGAAREKARMEYLASARMIPRDTEGRGRRWRGFREANAAYLRARGDIG